MIELACSGAIEVNTEKSTLQLPILDATGQA
jgi:hypothetical protein